MHLLGARIVHQFDLPGKYLGEVFLQPSCLSRHFRFFSNYCFKFTRTLRTIPLIYIYISVFFSLRLLALNSTLLLPYFCGCITFVLRISGCSIIHTWLGGIKFPLSFRLVNGLFTNFFFFFPPNLLSDVPVVGNNLMLTRSCIHVEQCYPYSLLNSCTKLTQHQSDRRKDGLYIKPMSL